MAQNIQHTIKNQEFYLSTIYPSSSLRYMQDNGTRNSQAIERKMTYAYTYH